MGRLFVASDDGHVFSGDEILRGWDTAERTELGGEFWDKKRGGPHCVSKDGRLFAMVKPTSIEIWDWAKADVTHTIAEAGETFRLAEFSPDAAMLATVGKSKKVRLWNIATGKPNDVELAPSGKNDIERLRFTPDGKYLLTVQQEIGRAHV